MSRHTKPPAKHSAVAPDQSRYDVYAYVTLARRGNPSTYSKVAAAQVNDNPNIIVQFDKIDHAFSENAGWLPVRSGSGIKLLRPPLMQCGRVAIPLANSPM